MASLTTTADCHRRVRPANTLLDRVANWFNFFLFTLWLCVRTPFSSKSIGGWLLMKLVSTDYIDTVVARCLLKLNYRCCTSALMRFNMIGARWWTGKGADQLHIAQNFVPPQAKCKRPEASWFSFCLTFQLLRDFEFLSGKLCFCLAWRPRSSYLHKVFVLNLIN